MVTDELIAKVWKSHTKPDPYSDSWYLGKITANVDFRRRDYSTYRETLVHCIAIYFPEQRRLKVVNFNNNNDILFNEAPINSLDEATSFLESKGFIFMDTYGNKVTLSILKESPKEETSATELVYRLVTTGRVLVDDLNDQSVLDALDVLFAHDKTVVAGKAWNGQKARNQYELKLVKENEQTK